MVTAVLRAELLKIRSVRSSALTLLLTVVAGIGLAILVALSFRNISTDVSGERQENFDPIFAGMYGLTLAQLALVVFAVLAVGGEYSSGTIRTTLTVLPRRGVFYGCKVLSVAMIAIGVSLVTALAAFLVAQAVLGPHGVSLGADGAPRAVVGSWVYLTLISLFALGLATMLRGSTRTLAVLLPLFFLGSQGLGNAPVIRHVTQFLPDQAGTMIMHLAGPPDDPMFDRAYGPWTGLGILALWTVAALAGGWLVLRRRDA